MELYIITGFFGMLTIFNTFMILAIVKQAGKNDNLKITRFLPLGEPAPDFSARTITGEEVNLANYIGRDLATLFLFISPNCGNCKTIIDQLETYKNNVFNSGIDIVLVSVGNEEATKKLLVENGVSFPVIFAPQSINSFKKDYKIPGTPSFCIVDTNSKVFATGLAHERVKEWQNLSEIWNVTT